ncbi:MAG: DNA polymerase III subunit chi [Pseudomonas helleri]|jgi:DNA polymerase III subunit chi
MTSEPDTELTKVDFYILPSAEPSARLDFACKLTEKAWRLGHRVYLHCSDSAQRQDLDERLWRFKGESFVPHSNTEDQPDGTIVMGLSEAPASHQDLLINLDLKVPEFFKRFARVAEVVVEDPAVRLAARESFRFYREHGYPLQDHKLQRL